MATFDTMAVWGPNVSYAFLSGRIEDIGKGGVKLEVKKAPNVPIQEGQAIAIQL